MPTLQSANINANTTGDNIIVAGVSGEIIQVVSIYFQCAGATTIQVKDGASINLTGPMAFPTGGGLVLLNVGQGPYFQTSTGNSLIFHLSVGLLGLAGQVGGQLMYYQF